MDQMEKIQDLFKFLKRWMGAGYKSVVILSVTMLVRMLDTVWISLAMVSWSLLVILRMMDKIQDTLESLKK